MLLAIQGFINVQSLFIAFLRNRVLFNAAIGIAKVEVTFRYREMLLAENHFFNGERLLIVFFSLIVLTKVAVDISQGKQKSLPVSGRLDLSRVRVIEGKITVNV